MFQDILQKVWNLNYFCSAEEFHFRILNIYSGKEAAQTAGIDIVKAS